MTYGALCLDLSVVFLLRKAQQFIDPDIDLTTVPYPWRGHAEWIRPLTLPLHERQD